MDGDVGQGGTRDDPATDPTGDVKGSGVYTTPPRSGDEGSSDSADTNTGSENTSSGEQLQELLEDPGATVEDPAPGAEDDGLLGTSLPQPDQT